MSDKKKSIWDRVGELMLKSQTTSPTSVTGGDAYGARAMQAFSEGDVEKAKEIQREEDTKAAMTMGTAAIIPEMAVTGVVPTLVATATGLAGGYVGNKAGSYLDEKLGTKWIAPTFSILGGIGGGITGSYGGLRLANNYTLNKNLNQLFREGKPRNFGQFLLNDKTTGKTWLGNTGYKLIGDGSEASVFAANKDYVLKVNTDLSEKSLDELLNSDAIKKYISNRNALPEQLPIKLEGYAYSPQYKKYMPVFEQERVASVLPEDFPQFEYFLNALNKQHRISKSGLFKSHGKKYQASDFQPQNIGIDKNGNYKYIDIHVDPSKHKQGGKLKLQSGNKITPEHARLLGRRGMPGDKEALAAAGYDSKGRPLVTFGGGSFGGAGAGASFEDGAEQVENYDYVRNTPILQSFSDAFNNARKSGLSSFTFNGKEYTTEMSDNPNYIGKKYQPLLNVREILDKNMKVMSDSTRIEPYVGQIPGTHRRKSSQ